MGYIYDINGNPIVTDQLTEFDMPIITGGLPNVYITSDTAYTSLTKEASSNGTLAFIDAKSKFEVPVKMKLQGNHSLDYAKKNLNITFYNESGSKQKIKFNSWYPTNKIHMKANEYDTSMCRPPL